MLKKSDVIFDEFNHSYSLNGLPLIGVTEILSKTIFKDKYSLVDNSILENAKNRGIKIHKEIELYDSNLKNTDNEIIPEVECYKFLTCNINHLESEFLVSNNINVATKIDKIDTEMNIYDIKTTYELDIEYLSWQLSFCAYLFEKQGNKSNKLFAIWLPKDISKSKIVEIKRKSDKDIELLIESYFLGNNYELPILKNNLDIEKLIDIENEIILIKERAKEYEKIKSEILSELEKSMIENDVKKFESDRLIITRVLPTTSKIFDNKRFEEENPLLYSNYIKINDKKGFLKLTIK